MPVIQTIATVIGSVAGVIATVIGQIISLVINVVAVVVSAVSQVTGVISGIISVVSSVFGTILSVISSVVSGVVSAVTGAFNTVVNVISSAVSSVVAFITGLASSISSTFSGIASTIGNAINGAGQRVAGRVQRHGQLPPGSFVGNLMSTIGGIPGRIQSAFSGAASWLVSAGRNIIQGLINGITGAISGAISAVQNAVGGIIDGAKNLLGIHSPSTVFRDEIGRMVGEGMAIGIRRETSTVSKAGQRARTGKHARVDPVAGFRRVGVARIRPGDSHALPACPQYCRHGVRVCSHGAGRIHRDRQHRRARDRPGRALRHVRDPDTRRDRQMGDMMRIQLIADGDVITLVDNRLDRHGDAWIREDGISGLYGATKPKGNRQQHPATGRRLLAEPTHRITTHHHHRLRHPSRIHHRRDTTHR